MSFHISLRAGPIRGDQGYAARGPGSMTGAAGAQELCKKTKNVVKHVKCKK